MNDKNKIYSIIMAGGQGKRFWPLSRSNRPKQFLKLLGDRSLLAETFHRLYPEISTENEVLIVTHADYVDLVKKDIEILPPENILIEPQGKNTGPAVGYSCVPVLNCDPEAVVAVFPSDHVIRPRSEFQDAIRLAADKAAREECIVTLGIPPTSPATGYGYIEIAEAVQENSAEIHEVLAFTEKPDLSKAVEYFKSNRYFWNSGIFIFQVKAVLRAFQKLLPQVYDGMITLLDNWNKAKKDEIIEDCFKKFDFVSFDVGIMNHYSPIYTIPANFYWNDVGDFSSFFDELRSMGKAKDQNNISNKDIFFMDCRNAAVHAKERFGVVIGCEDVVIIDTPDVFLVCDKDKTQEINKVVNKLSSDSETIKYT